MRKTLFTGLLLFMVLMVSCRHFDSEAIKLSADMAQKRAALISLIEKQAVYSDSIELDSVIAWGKALLPTLHTSRFQTQHDNDLNYLISLLVCNAYNLRGDFALSLRLAHATYDHATEEHYPFGSVVANMAIGNAYSTIANVTDQALDAYRDALNELNHIAVNHPYKPQVLLKICHILHRCGQTDEAGQCLDELASIIDSHTHNVPTHFFYYLERAHYHLSQPKSYTQVADSAGRYLTLMDSIYQLYPERFYRFHLRYTEANYLRTLGVYRHTHWQEAESIYNRLIAEYEHDKIETYHRQTSLEKIKLYQMQNKPDEACHIYLELYPDNDTLRAGNYLQQINDLKLQYEMERIHRETLAAGVQVSRLQVGCGLLTLILTIIITLILHRRKIKLRRNAQMLEEARLHAEVSMRNKSLFLSNMSHEIRTPLNAINGFSDLLATPGLDGETRRLCNDAIAQNSDLLLSLINDVIDFSNIEQGKMPFSLSQTNVVEVCRNVVDTVDKVKQTAATVSFNSSLSELSVYTDPSRLQQVLINLLINATKFTKQGSITLSLELDAASDHALFSVTDTGCGIPHDKQNSIFIRFEKLSEKAQGSGLGLSICRLIIENLGGKIWVDPDYTEGARFCFTHPLKQPCAEPTPQAASVHEKKKTTWGGYIKAMIFRLLNTFAILFVTAFIAARPLTPEQKQTKDSLEYALKQATTNSMQMLLLHQLALLHQDSPEFLTYEGAALQRAVATHNLDMQSRALYAHVVYYYNAEIDDSTYVWARRMTDFCKKHDYYQYYFNAQRILTEYYIDQGKAEFAIIEAKEMTEKAKALHDIKGLRAAYAGLTSSYFATMQYDKGLTALEEALATIGENTKNYDCIELYSQAVLNYARTQHNDRMLHHARLLHRCYSQLADTTSATGRNIKNLVLNAHVLYYTRTGQSKEAATFLAQSEEVAHDQLFYSYRLFHLAACAEYYELVGEYSKALHALNSLIEQVHQTSPDDYLHFRCQKAGLLLRMNRPNNACQFYRNTVEAHDSLYKQFTNNQLTQLQDLNDLEHLRWQKTQLLRRLRIATLASILIIVVLLLIFNWRMHITRRHLRAQEEELRRLAKLAEEANDLKGRFLSNISYSIRIPLNNVVGFAQLLALEADLSDDDRQQFSAIIKHDSGELIDMVNDILDLSRLEANMTKWQMTDISLHTWTRELITMAEIRSEGKTKVSLTQPDADVDLHIDSMRLNRCLLFMLLPPDATAKSARVSLTLSCRTSKKWLTGTVDNSPMTTHEAASQMTSVRKDICRLFFSHFGGTFSMDLEARQVSFTLPFYCTDDTHAEAEQSVIQ